MSPDRALFLALTQPWLLARALLALGALSTLLAAAVMARRRGRERGALLHLAIRAAAAAQTASLLVGALAAQRLVAAVPGAMCAMGVLDASPWGPRAAWTAAGATLVLAAADGAAAVDRRLRHARMDGPLVAAGVLAFVACAADLGAGLGFAASLDLDDTVPCCAAPEVTRASMPAASRAGALVAAALAGVVVRSRVPAGLAWVALVAAWTFLTREAARALISTPVHPCLACGLGRGPWGPLLGAGCAWGAVVLARGLAPLGLLGATNDELRAEATGALRRGNRAVARWGLVAVALLVVTTWR
ncbi:MAG: hypothetical protein U0325_34910 [Polyangiales bacterium]